MSISGIILAAVVVGGTGLVISILLGIASEKFKVPVDEKEVAVRECLPGNNCGGCGFAGCDALAKAIAAGEAPVGACPVGGQPVADKIASIMGVEAGAGEKQVAFVKEEITNTFGEFLAKNGKKQARIAETEKYAHVTFFFNGGVEEPNEGEDRILVKSPKVATYDLKPEMSAYEVCDKLVAAIKSDEYDVIVINFANPDMVGHTGVIEAAVKAIEAVDECVGKAYEALKEADGQMFICADHGNAEYMIDEETKEPFTAHTTNPVPFILVNADPAYKLKEGGCLADIAPTLIELMGMEQPAEMTGTSLLVK